MTFEYTIINSEVELLDLLDDRIKDAYEQWATYKESVFMEAIRGSKYTFTSKEELRTFIKNNCQIVNQQDTQQSELRIDGKAVLTWNETVRIENHKIVFGKPLETRVDIFDSLFLQ